ncbi:uncharacterized protein BDR25DRAFT_49236 [Lindgomyces ingoldianus]|uniref:Uncharacterized protein n=1 Tax=Lindgomyces ingoldianus TaxID=673940 RepID=A0ACB6QQY6_9PLEO|nr:uncharacterized protein BDR25DRAFT_49236 [Lindgomyces ingoldianus]KAF2469413.1 hypothetical protein BDR25DRAFT_49236 [Lindgomyces ingoldianus]
MQAYCDSNCSAPAGKVLSTLTPHEMYAHRRSTNVLRHSSSGTSESEANGASSCQEFSCLYTNFQGIRMTDILRGYWN